MDPGFEMYDLKRVSTNDPQKADSKQTQIGIKSAQTDTLKSSVEVDLT